MKRLFGILLFLMLQIMPHTALADDDPWEGFNRKVHNFNDVADRKIIRPVAIGYDKVMPDPAKRLVANFFGNLTDVGDAINNLLQGKPGQAAGDAARVLVNTTLGLGGLFDPAVRMGLVDHEEDFSQTLAVWGVPRGPYLVMPLLGPGSVRDVAGLSVDSVFDPLLYYQPTGHRYALYGLSAMQGRAEFLDVESAVFGDKYIFYRDAYLQRREFMEKDGAVEDPFDDEF